MHRFAINTIFAAGLLASLAPALAVDEHPSVKRAFKLAPSADLLYAIILRQHGLQLSGEGTLSWRASENAYSIMAETRSPLFGKVLENKSEGEVDAWGLAPERFYEKRIRNDPVTTTFKRDSKTIVFTDSGASYPLKGGEQDRSSAAWQLIAVARAAPEKMVAGSEWDFFVAGQRDAEPWVFKVKDQEMVHLVQGDVSAVHLVKAPPPDAKGQQVDIWLAPSLEWYPVRLRFADHDGDFVEQTLEKISKK